MWLTAPATGIAMCEFSDDTKGSFLSALGYEPKFATPPGHDRTTSRSRRSKSNVCFFGFSSAVPPGAVAQERGAVRLLLTRSGCGGARSLQPFRHLHDCSGCFRLERSPDGSCTHWKAPPYHGEHPSGHSGDEVYGHQAYRNPVIFTPLP